MPFSATWMELETLILSEASQKEKYKYRDITYIWNVIYGTVEPFHRKKIMDLENRLVATQGEREGVGGIGSLGISDTTWNGLTMRSC